MTIKRDDQPGLPVPAEPVIWPRIFEIVDGEVQMRVRRTTTGRALAKLFEEVRREYTGEPSDSIDVIPADPESGLTEGELDHLIIIDDPFLAMDAVRRYMYMQPNHEPFERSWLGHKGTISPKQLFHCEDGKVVTKRDVLAQMALELSQALPQE